MDPVASFRHSDLDRECISERNWQKLNADRVLACQFDCMGRYLAVYCNWNAIELWDFTSLPVVLTSVVLPKHLSNRVDGNCHSLTWSTCSTQVAGVFGPRPQQGSTAKRKAHVANEIEAINVHEMYKASYFILWDVADRSIKHKFRFVSRILNASGVLVTKSTFYCFGLESPSS